jgi:serine/threonine protein kinase
LDGLARADTQTQHTALGQIVGTPAFLAPEAALGDQAVDSRADLYALGCVGYRMLTGHKVFDETNAIALAVAHITKESQPPSQRVQRPIDSALEQIVLDCLQKDRERRPSSAAALRDRLAAIALTEPWTRERAQGWWRENLPQNMVSPAGNAEAPAS